MAPLTGYKISDITALKAIAPEDRSSGYMRSVESVKAWYQFVESDSTPESGLAVIEPDSGTGRWFKSNISDALEIPNLDEFIQDSVAGFLQAGTNISLTYDDLTNTLTIGQGTGSFVSQAITHTTSSIASGGYELFSLSVPNFSHAYRVVTDSPARVRLYINETLALSDLSRPVLTELSGEHGCFLEVVTILSNLDLKLAPTAPIYVDAGETDIKVTCINTSGSATPVTFTLYIYRI